MTLLFHKLKTFVVNFVFKPSRVDSKHFNERVLTIVKTKGSTRRERIHIWIKRTNKKKPAVVKMASVEYLEYLARIHTTNKTQTEVMSGLFVNFLEVIITTGAFNITNKKYMTSIQRKTTHLVNIQSM